MPDEIGRAGDAGAGKLAEWPYLNHQTTENAVAFTGKDRQDRVLHDLTGKDESLAEAAVRGDALPRWKVGDPIEVPEFTVRERNWDVVPGVPTPDYRNPDAPDTLKLRHGQEVIVGKHGSTDNPRRFAEVRHDEIVDKPTDEPPELPSGEDLKGLKEDRKSKYERLYDEFSKPDFIEGAKDIGTEYVQKSWDALKPLEPTGSYTATPDRPVATQTPHATADLGILTTVPVILWIGFDRTARFIKDKIDELRQPRGEPDHADN